MIEEWPGWGSANWLTVDADADPPAHPGVGFFTTGQERGEAPPGDVSHLQFGYPASPDNP